MKSSERGAEVARNHSPSRKGTASETSTGDNARLIVGISGASGTVLGRRILELCRELPVETHLVISRAGEMTAAYETGDKRTDLAALADRHYAINDIGAAIASGSYRSHGMIIAPCSIKTMSEIATGVTGNLLTRAADVMLKERRPLVLMVREMPLHAGHLRNMLSLAELGAIIAPPVPAFYDRPRDIDEMVEQMAARALDLAGIDNPYLHRWQQEED